ncbi:MAG: hypothetical protein ACK502_05265 [Alphaproteobacteria bacterium]
MDYKLKIILNSLLTTINVLDTELSRIARCDLLKPNSENFELLERVRTMCTDTLQNLDTIERKLENDPFVIPERELALLE